jgi:outer membrane protein assembly factor BamB
VLAYSCLLFLLTGCTNGGGEVQPWHYKTPAARPPALPEPGVVHSLVEGTLIYIGIQGSVLAVYPATGQEVWRDEAAAAAAVAVSTSTS